MSFTSKHRYRGRVRAVILDWAGTTLDFGCMAPAVVFMEVFGLEGVPITLAEARAPMGAHKRVHIRKITEQQRVRERWRELKGRDPDADDVERMFERFVPLQLACLADYADLIPGTLETIDALRARGIKIGSTTGFTRAMTDLLLGEAKARGYEPDASVCAEEVPVARPAPFMCLKNLITLEVWPVAACIKVDDTLPGIEEGLNAGMWTVGLAASGNEVGLGLTEYQALDPEDRRERVAAAKDRMREAGAHFVVETIADLLPCVDAVQDALSQGIRP